MTAYPYCKSKKLEVRHIGGYPFDVIHASDVESMLKAINLRIMDFTKEIEELRGLINQTYDAQNG